MRAASSPRLRDGEREPGPDYLRLQRILPSLLYRGAALTIGRRYSAVRPVTDGSSWSTRVILCVHSLPGDMDLTAAPDQDKSDRQ